MNTSPPMHSLPCFKTHCPLLPYSVPAVRFPVLVQAISDWRCSLTVAFVLIRTAPVQHELFDALRLNRSVHHLSISRFQSQDMGGKISYSTDDSHNARGAPQSMYVCTFSVSCLVYCVFRFNRFLKLPFRRSYR